MNAWSFQMLFKLITLTIKMYFCEYSHHLKYKYCVTKLRQVKRLCRRSQLLTGTITNEK